MFKYKITLSELAYDDETGRTVNATVEGVAPGNIEDHMKRIIRIPEPDGFEIRWVRIGDTLVRYASIISIQTEAVKE